MKQRFVFLLLMLFSPLMLTGCWNYRGINEMDIVTGAAVDWNNEKGLYQLTFEIVDIASATSQDATKTKYVESEGITMLDAVRNAKKRLINKLYFGNMQILIISHQLAETQGLYPVMQAFIRDGELRETLCLVIAQENRAKDIILAQGIDSLIVSYEIKKVIHEDNEVTASTVMTPMFKAYGSLKENGKSLVLPAFHCTINNEQLAPEANGAALFEDDRLMGYFTPEETRYYLFITGKIKGGSLSFALEEGLRENVALEIKQNKTKTTYSYDEGGLTISLDIKTEANLTEAEPGMDLSKSSDQKKLEQRAAAVLKRRILQTLNITQSRYGIDLFDFGNMLYKDNPDLWRQLEGDWDSIFAAAEFNVQTEVRILHTGVMTAY